VAVFDLFLGEACQRCGTAPHQSVQTVPYQGEPDALVEVCQPRTHGRETDYSSTSSRRACSSHLAVSTGLGGTRMGPNIDRFAHRSAPTGGEKTVRIANAA
jgi:hypothetical protein